MYIKILNKSFELDNEFDSVEKLFNLINHTLQGSSYYFSHIVIDGIEVFDHFEETIRQSIDQIKEIEVKVKTIDEFVHDCLSSTSAYLNRALPEIERLNDQLYQGPEQNTWSTFLDFLEGMQWIQQVVTTVQEVPYPLKNKQVYHQVSTILPAHLQVLEEGLKNKDYVLLADVIQYEIIPLLETLNKEIRSLISGEMHHDSHR